MTMRIRRLSGPGLAALVLVCPPAPSLAAAAGTEGIAPNTREPAVAGLFYPRDPAVLARVVDTCLAEARSTPPPGELKALICPHAGYPYSGPVAASGYKLLEGRSYDTVVVLGPSHYAVLGAGSITNATVYRTPLGDVPISPKARQLASLPPFALEPRCLVQRPGWWREASHPPSREDKADTWEHSVEVEVPFLQRTLKHFALVPVVCGEFEPERAARALTRILDDHTLIVVSSDLSHYHPYAGARELDRRTITAIGRLDPDGVTDEGACGHTPIRTLLVLARRQGWKAQLLDARNSGDTAGGRSRVVGYAAIAFYTPRAPSAHTTAAQRRFLLDLARRTVRAAATAGRVPEAPPSGLDPRLTRDAACFVTLTKQGSLRGCIGSLAARGPLYRDVIENARNAALRDPRFPAVSAREVDDLEIEISVLTEPQPLFFSSAEDLLRKLHPGFDGVVLQIGRCGATYLPQVWEQIPDKVDFLNSLAEKAGCAPSDWRRPDTVVLIYHVESFKESEVSTAGSAGAR